MKPEQPKAPRKRATTPRRAGHPEPRRVAFVEPSFRLKSILVPVDFSEPSRKGLRYACAMAGYFDARITLLFVLEPVFSPDFNYFPLALDTGGALRNAEKKLRAWAKEESAGLGRVDNILVWQGKPYLEICEAARALNIDLVVIATHGHTGVKRVWLGSTAERVVREAPCPVLVVRPHGHEFIIDTPKSL
jgi:universal stress protein A